MIDSRTIMSDVWSFTTGTSGIHDNKATNYNVYPNPAQDEIRISGVNGTVHYSVHNMLGTKLFDGIAENNSKINISHLHKGMYIVLMQAKPVKFIKE